MKLPPCAVAAEMQLWGHIVLIKRDYKYIKAWQYTYYLVLDYNPLQIMRATYVLVYFVPVS